MQTRAVDITGRKFQVEADVATSFWDLWEAKGWQPHTTRVFDRFVHPEKAVIDMGAWAGPLSLYAAQLTRGDIHAIEPDAVVFRQLERNLRANPALQDRFFCHSVAIGPKDTEALLFSRREFGDSSSSLVARSRDQGETVTIPVQRFASFAQMLNNSPVGFIKMDIEGAEFEVIPDMAPWLMAHKPTLLLSLHGNYFREHFFKNKGLGRLRLSLEERLSVFPWSDGPLMAAVRSLLKALEGYRYIYAENGQVVRPADLLHSKTHLEPVDLVFTDEKW
ncbi:MAG: FkbM family methyltransferase [Salibacteraceae bacterium]